MSITRIRPINTGAGQKGAVLVVVLAILIVLTLLGITSMTTTTLEEKMAGNAKDANLAFQAAESALRGGESWLWKRADEPDRSPGGTSCTGCVWDVNVLIDYDRITDGTNDGKYNSYGDESLWSTTEGPGTVTVSMPVDAWLKANPQYVIEYIGILRDTQNVGQQQDIHPSTYRVFYRIVSRGSGATVGRAIAESTFTRRF